MKKYTKAGFIIVVVAAVVIAMFYYESNKTSRRQTGEIAAANEEVAALTTRNLEQNYPQSVKEVLKYYMRITKAYYDSATTDEQLEQLAKQARILFDDELKAKQTDSEYLKALKEDIASYKKNKRYISNYKLDDSDHISYQMLQGKEYASMIGLYYIRQDSNLSYSYTKFTLRKDDNGHYKILFWELADKEDLE